MARRIRNKPASEEDGDLPESPEMGEDISSQDEDSRLRRAADSQRRTRAEDDAERRLDEGLATDRSERLSDFRDEFTEAALPRLPNLPGFHLCWLSTTNTYDPIPRRIRMGYTPVTPEDLPGFEYLTQKSGQWEGFIGINEMLLFKVPLTLWKQMMEHYHHSQPMEEEQGIRERARSFAEGMRDSKGESLVELEPDMESLGRPPSRKPIFKD